MLKSVVLRNFKLHALTKIEALPLTVFIGPNNSGKTSIFQALLLLRQSVQRNRNVGVLLDPVPRQPTNQDDPFLYDPDHQIDPGAFEDIVHSGEQEVGFEIAGQLDDQDPRYGGRRDVSLVLAFRQNQAAYHTGTMSFDVKIEAGERRLAWAWTRGPMAGAPQQSSVGLLGRNFLFSAVEFPQMLQVQGFSGGPTNDPAQVAELSSFQNQIAQLPNSLLKSVHPVYPLRGLEESGYPVTLGPEASIDRIMLADRTLALLSVLAYRNDVLDQVSNWLENLIQTRVRTKLVPGRRVTFVCEPVDRRVKSRRGGLFSNEGTGASQLPFILLPIALCRSNETVMISEPEAHLHPRAQSELARLFIRILSSERKQLLIETHSEHILNALLHAVARGDLSKEDLAIYYFESQDGVSHVRRLVVDDYGRVEGGLPGFFDQSLTELTDYLETLKKK